MSDRELPEAADAPEATALLLTIFAEFYRQEMAAEEDVFRSLPFFGTAIGLVFAALAYAAGRLPERPQAWTEPGSAAFLVSVTLLGVAAVEAGGVLLWLSRAIAGRRHERIGPESVLRLRMAELMASREKQGLAADLRDRALVADLRLGLLNSYAAVTPVNRKLNQRRIRYRARASSHLIRSLIWALAATTVIFMSDKLGYLPKVIP